MATTPLTISAVPSVPAAPSAATALPSGASLPSGLSLPSGATAAPASSLDPLAPSLVPQPTPAATGWARFADPDYYFNQTPFEQPFLWGRPLALLFTVLLVAAFALLVRAQLPRLKHRADVRATAYWLLFFGLLGNTFLFFRWEHVPVLSMRIWLILVLVGLGVWIIGRLYGMIAKRMQRASSARTNP